MTMVYRILNDKFTQVIADIIYKFYSYNVKKTNNNYFKTLLTEKTLPNILEIKDSTLCFWVTRYEANIMKITKYCYKDQLYINKKINLLLKDYHKYLRAFRKRNQLKHSKQYYTNKYNEKIICN